MKITDLGIKDMPLRKLVIRGRSGITNVGIESLLSLKELDCTHNSTLQNYKLL
jgi:hypothetical protein